MRKILFVNPCADISGAEMSLLVLMKYLDRTKYTPLLLIPNEGILRARAEALGATVRVFPMHAMTVERNFKASLRDSFISAGELGQIARLLKELSPDLVHVNSYRVGIPFSLASRKLHIPSVWHLRDIPESGAKKKLLSISTRLPDKTIAISHAVAFALGKKLHSGLIVIHNGVEINLFQNVQPGKFRKELNLAEDTILLCSIGQLIPWKGHDLLIEAFQKLSVEQPLHLVIVGGNVSPIWASSREYSDYREYLEQLVDNHNLKGRVTFTGFRDDIPQILTDIDLYIHTATSPEPFGRVLVEAMAAKKPVVAPNWGGIPEIVTDNVTGLLYEPKNVAHLAERLEFAFENLQHITQMGEVGLKVAREQFTAEKYVEKVQAVYEGLL